MLQGLLFCLCLFCFQNIAQAEPLNLELYKQKLIQYHDTGQYYQEISKKIKEAMTYLKFRIEQNQRALHPKKLAIVLDIDETSLSNYQNLKKIQFCNTNKNWQTMMNKANALAIPYTKALYNFATTHQVAVFFVTGRSENWRDQTVKNLKQQGYGKYQALYMRPADYHQASAAPYKSATRRQITQQGYDIILNIGDQQSDLRGGYADMQYKLPNPYYYVP